MLVFTCVYFIGWNKSVKIDACLAMLARCWWHIFSKDLPYLLMSSWRVGENFEKFVHDSLTLESQTCEQHILYNVRPRPPSPTSNHISWYQYIIWFIWYLAYDMIQIYEYYVTSLLDTCCMYFFCSWITLNQPIWILHPVRILLLVLPHHSGGALFDFDSRVFERKIHHWEKSKIAAFWVWCNKIVTVLQRRVINCERTVKMWRTLENCDAQQIVLEGDAFIVRDFRDRIKDIVSKTSGNPDNSSYSLEYFSRRIDPHFAWSRKRIKIQKFEKFGEFFGGTI